MSKYNSACSSLRAGQLDRLMKNIKDKKVNHETGYKAHFIYFCKEMYSSPEGNWLHCPNCGLRPQVWVYDNGRSTGCGCGNNDYDHFSIYAESIMSVFDRTEGKKMTEYKAEGLMNNWNHWVMTGEILFEHPSKRTDGRW